MNRLILRSLFPAIVDTHAYSCRSYLPSFGSRAFSVTRHLSQQDESSSPVNSDNINPHFTNRNPRNLEQLGLARKRKGWKFQYPNRTFYHRLMFDRSGKFIRAWVEHTSGNVVLSASAGEMAIAKHLYSTEDVSASANVGRVLAQRCRESGITAMISLPPETGESSPKYQAFIRAIEEGGIELSEPEEIQPAYEPGIAYDDELEYGDLLRRQELVNREPNVRWGTKDNNWI